MKKTYWRRLLSIRVGKASKTRIRRMIAAIRYTISMVYVLFNKTKLINQESKARIEPMVDSSKLKLRSNIPGSTTAANITRPRSAVISDNLLTCSFDSFNFIFKKAFSFQEFYYWFSTIKTEMPYSQIPRVDFDFRSGINFFFANITFKNKHKFIHG